MVAEWVLNPGHGANSVETSWTFQLQNPRRLAKVETPLWTIPSRFRIDWGIPDETSKHVRTLLYCLGEEADAVLASTHPTEEEKKSYDSAVTQRIYVVKGLKTDLLGLPAITALNLAVRVDANNERSCHNQEKIPKTFYRTWEPRRRVWHYSCNLLPKTCPTPIAQESTTRVETDGGNGGYIKGGPIHRVVCWNGGGAKTEQIHTDVCWSETS